MPRVAALRAYTAPTAGEAWLEPQAGFGERALVSEPDPIADLVRAARAGDRGAFAELYRRFSRTVHGVVLARVEPRDAGDVAQEVFLLALERLHQLDDPAAFPGWILSIARKRAAERIRQPRPLELVHDPVAREVPSAEARRALEAIRDLPEAYREPLILRLVEGMTGPEIAARTGLAPGSVRVNLHRGMKLLRERLGIGESPADADEPRTREVEHG
jgi:RNA polymerase sigma-70 factor (ECF subfamily)